MERTHKAIVSDRAQKIIEEHLRFITPEKPLRRKPSSKTFVRFPPLFAGHACPVSLLSGSICTNQ
jgi:hypothetical protein